MRLWLGYTLEALWLSFKYMQTIVIEDVFKNSYNINTVKMPERPFSQIRTQI